MLSLTACPDVSGKSRQSGKKLEYWKYCLTIISLVLVSIQIQAQNGWWINVTTLPTGRGATSASVIDDKIYVIGGNTGAPGWIEKAENEVYDPLTDTWDTTKSDMPTPRGWLTTAVVNDIIYAIGGGYPAHTNTNEAYDPVTDTWTIKAPMPTVRRGMQSGVVDGIIYVIGGNEISRDCLAYDPVANSWTIKAPVPVGGGGDLALAVYNGLIYAFGGGYYTVGPYSNVYAYNPQTDQWTQKASMSTPRFAMQAYVDVLGEKIYVIGGSQSYSTSLSIVEVYDPVNDTWETSPDTMPVPLCFFAGAVVNNRFYVISGTSDWQSGDGSVWEYTPPSVPVELTSFTASANGKEVTLSWSTATEANNSGFEIERRIITGGISGNWNKIGFTPGFGTTTEPKEYSYVDNISGINANALAYRLKQMDFDGSYEYSDEVFVDKLAPAQFVLEQNYPNPFNPTTTIGFGLQSKSNVKIVVLNSIGEEVAVVLNEEREPGFYQVEFNAANLPSGVYFYQLKAGSYVETKKMILMK